MSLPSTYSFDGMTTFLNLGATSQTIPSSFSIVMWLTAKSVSTKQDLMTYGRSGNNCDGEFVFYLDSSGHLGFWDYGSGAYGFSFENYYGTGSNVGIATVSAGTRTHVAFVRDGLQGTFYVNGVQAGPSITSSHDVTYTNENLCLGFDYRDQRDYFGGVMEQVQILGAALSASDVYSLYSGKK